MTTRGWWVMTVLALGVSLYALMLLVNPQMRPPFLAGSPIPLALLAHFGGGALAMALGPFQFLSTWRARRPTLHRWMGRAYVTAILLSGSAGLALSGFSQGGMVAHVGFGLLAVCWLVTTGAAFVTVRQGDYDAHRQWMIRSFSLTLAAVTLRLYLPMSIAAGVPFETAYPVIAWACWVPNLIVAEWAFVGAARPARQRRATA